VEWYVKSEEEGEGKETLRSASEILAMLHRDRLSYSDEIRRPGPEELWRPIYAVPEVTVPLKSFLEGLHLFEGRRYNEALKAFSLSLTEPSLFLESSMFMGIIHGYKDNFERAIPFFQECHNFPPLERLVSNNLSVCHASLGRLNKGLTGLQRIPSFKQKRSRLLERVIRLWKGIDAEQRGEQ